MLRQSVWNKKFINSSGLLFAVVCLVLFSLALPAVAQDASEQDDHDSHARIVRVSYVEGEVRLDNGRGYENVTMNVPVMEHNWLQTRSNGWAEIQMEDGSMIRVSPDTVIAFTGLGRSDSGATSTTIDLDQGEVEFKILKSSGSDFQVTVKNKTIAVDSSGWFRVTSTNDDPTEVAVRKGEVSIHDPESGEDVAVKKNETFALNPADPTQYALDKGVEEDALDTWSHQRDQSLQAYAANHSMQSPYQYGSSDLSYYGQYSQDAQYGNVWQPYGVSMDWDPFSNGYWADTSGGGVWVSSYPWGWMPYRYGHWVFINGRGWFWQPGGWNNWNNGPHIINAPPGFHAPTPPAITRVMTRGPATVPRTGTPAANPASGHGIATPVGRTFSGNNNSDNPDSMSRRARGRSVHVFTNDEVQTTPPQEPVKTGGINPNNPTNATPKDGTPKTVQRQQHADGTTAQQQNSGHVQIDRQARRQANNASQQASQERTRESAEQRPTPAPVREYRAPAQAPVVRQQTAPAPPVVHQPVASPPAVTRSMGGGSSESHSSGSQSGGKNPRR